MKYCLLIVVMAILFPFHSHGKTPSFSEPDFDYPQQVEKKAQAMLSEADAMASGSAGPVRLRALVELCAARKAVDPDARFALPAFVAAQLDAANNTPADRAMLLALEAYLYNQIYENSRWTYDRVAAPLLPLPADVSEWSGEQFRTEINRLIDEAISIPEAATASLADYTPAVECDSISLRYIPVVRDFLLLSGADMNRRSDDTAYIDKALEYAASASPAFFYWSCRKIEMASGDADGLLKLYQEYSGVEAARYVLLEDAQRYYTTADRADENRRIVALIEESLSRFPEWYGNPGLKSQLRRISAPRANLSLKEYLGTGRTFTVTVKYCFANKLTVGLYYLGTNHRNLSASEIATKFKPEQTQAVDSLPDGVSRLVFSPSKQGDYAVVASMAGADGRMIYADKMVESTPYIPVLLFGRDKYEVMTLGFADGAPYKGVKVSQVFNSYGKRNQAPVALGTTNAEGLLSFSPVTDYSHLRFTDKGITTDFFDGLQLNLYRENAEDSGASGSVTVFTDRPVYHPGDSIRWAIVCARKSKDASTLADARVLVQMFDANSELVDSISVVTDRFGRADGVFATRTGALTGNYLIRADLDFDGVRDQAYNLVMVSDFRPPVLYAEITSVQRGVPSEGDVRVEGRARTFSGMPVAGAKVNVELVGAERWWRYIPRAHLGEFELTTDADGSFAIDFTADVLNSETNDEDEPYTDFIANFTVTAPDASSASVTSTFSTGKPYSLSVSLPATHDASAPLSLTFHAYNADGKEAPLAVKWALAPVVSSNEPAEPVLQGDATCGTPVGLDVADIPAGRYEVRLTPVDETLAEEFTTHDDVVLYNIARNLVPASGVQPFFLPSDNYTLAADGSAEVTIGVTAPTHIYTVLDRNGNIESIRHTLLPEGFSVIPVTLTPRDDSEEKATLMILSVSDGVTNTTQVYLKRPAVERPKLVADVFRDRLTPGTTETWRIRLVDAIGNPLPDVAAIATMYNRSLEELCPSNWRSAFSFSTRHYYVGHSSLWNYYKNFYLTDDKVYNNLTRIIWPQWRYISRSGIMIRGLAMNKAMATADLAAAEDVLVEYEEPLQLNESLVGAVVGVSMASGADSVESEVAFDEDAADEGGDNADADDSGLRQSEVLQAFWMPSLVADDQGNVDVVFTVPNANATWTFRSLAWTPQTLSANLALEALANKPVMVQPNLPRFLRQGDRARVLATVYNNSGDAASVATTVEIFDFNSGEVLHTATSTDSILADASVLVGVEIDVPSDRAAVGYRVRARLGSFSDGEQALIPVLSSSATVIESSEFYLNPADAAPFTFEVPASADATVTLQYCQNPIWTVVRAMRGLGSESGCTSNVLASKLFSALAARHIIAGNPAVAQAISQWKANPDEQALVSMLSRNDDLKKLMLNQTPWVQAASDQSSRMASLADVLDPDAAQKAVSTYVDELGRLAAADGGLRWASWSSESSVWASRTFLITLGIANSLGMLPDDNPALDGLISSAWDYVQAQAVKGRVPDTDVELAFIASMFGRLEQTAEAAQLIRRTVVALQKDWKGQSLTAKAYALLILKANRKPDVCADILASIRQFAVDRPGMGVCFPSVNDIRSYATIIQAYKAMDAPAAEIDALRQWVIVQAQASDDIFAYNPDYVIAAVLLTGTDWTDVEVSHNVTVDGRPLVIDNVESATGYFSRQLDASGRPVTVTVTPNGKTPSYGSVTSISRRPMSKIKARAGRDISIEKRVLVKRNGKWVETSRFALGERLQVQLTIKARRAIDYVSIDDERPATFEPVDQLPGYIYADGLGFYRENLDASTRLFIGHMPAGAYHLTYEMTANVAGSFISGIATIQSQYAPELTAHSSAAAITVE